MVFAKGQSGNPNGRPRGTGAWTKVRGLLMKAFEEDPDRLIKALKKEYDAAPTEYMQKYIMPFMPRSLEIENKGDVKGKKEKIVEANAVVIDLKKRLGDAKNG